MAVLDQIPVVAMTAYLYTPQNLRAGAEKKGDFAASQLLECRSAVKSKGSYTRP